MSAIKLVEVYDDTRAWVIENKENLNVATPQSFRGLFDLKDVTKRPSRRVPYQSLTSEEIFHPKPIVSVVNMDTIDAARDLQNQGYYPLVLNMANARRAGGGVERGARAQEEDLFRRSDYHKHLPQNFYPLADDEIIISPNVTVFKNATYDYLKKPFSMDFVACAGICRPQLTPEGTLNLDDALLTFTKCQQLLQAAVFLGYDSIVLGALGCGAFQNPPEHVALLFKEAIATAIPEKSLKKIVFAILSKNTSNFEVFQKALSN